MSHQPSLSSEMIPTVENLIECEGHFASFSFVFYDLNYLDRKSVV